ncbi:MAG: diaminopimelate epimerase [Fimbriimonadaceae bacterium]|nr:diaminopimelate epimerase [Fimbriimonadaceae bacterium]QYK55426.1 MAG: diaminopimelate epimerase [Fimbriimonadaceae bacterium]
MRFVKMHGIGNDFVLVNGEREAVTPGQAARLAVPICDRKFGVGSDGLIVAYPGPTGSLAMRMWNPDGSESEMCGNGVRCFANFARDEGLTDSLEIPVETGAGLLTLSILADGRVRVDMGPARLTRGEIGMAGPAGETFVAQTVQALGATYSGTAVSMGNPHLVLFVEDPEAIELTEVGPALEHHALFPNRTNVHFAKAESRSRVKMRTWERGAGVTLACGTGACAVAVAAHLNGLADRRATLALPGGELEIEYQEDGRVFMTGPATKVFEGEWSG